MKKNIFLVSLLFLLSSLSGCSHHSYPVSENYVLSQGQEDIQQFLDDADYCLYIAGTWNSSLSKEAQQSTDEAIVAYCAPAAEQQA